MQLALKSTCPHFFCADWFFHLDFPEFKALAVAEPWSRIRTRMRIKWLGREDARTDHESTRGRLNKDKPRLRSD